MRSEIEADRLNAISADLQGARVALVNVPANDCAEITEALLQARCVWRKIDVVPRGRPGAVELYDLDRYDILLLTATDDGVGIAQTEAVTLSRPWLLLGNLGLIARHATLYARADDIVFTPCTMNELLFRASRALRRRTLADPPAVRRHRKSVLIADDDPDIRRLLQSVLNSHNLDVYFSNDGRDTLNKAREFLPDLVVLDVNMPILDGFEVLRLLRSDECTRTIKVVLLTAATEPADVQTGSALGADDYVGKPFNHLTFVRKIKGLLDGPPSNGF